MSERPNIKDELASIRRNGDPRISAEGKAAIAQLLESDEWWAYVDQVAGGDPYSDEQ